MNCSLKFNKSIRKSFGERNWILNRLHVARFYSYFLAAYHHCLRSFNFNLVTMGKGQVRCIPNVKNIDFFPNFVETQDVIEPHFITPKIGHKCFCLTMRLVFTAYKIQFPFPISSLCAHRITDDCLSRTMN